MKRTPEALLVASLAPVFLGCAGAPPPPPPVVAHVEPPPAAPPPLPPSRWLELGGATAVGPALPEGTLVLVGGRRALVDKDGVMHAEKDPSPEALQEILAVPTASGQRLLARGLETIFRLDDPLGAPHPLVRLDSSIIRLGAGPGVLAVWTARSEIPLFVDVETGKPKPLAGLPEPPLRAIAFLDQKRGTAVFEAAGLATTSDGGASWKLAGDTNAGDALRMNGLRRRGDALRAFTYADGPDAAIDLGAGKLSALEQPQAPPNEAPLLRWIRLTGRDPLEAAVAGGIEMGTGGALIASHGLLGRVDTRTGALLQLTEFAHAKWMNPCTTAHAGASAIVGCTVSEEMVGSDVFDPFGVFTVSLNAPELKADKPSLVRNGDAELVAAPSGGAMLLGACTSEDEAEACVRQPDGKWVSVHTEIDLNGHGAGPTADGKIAILRGLFDGDDAPDLEQGGAAPPAQVAGDDEDAPRPRRVHVSLIDPTGKEHGLPPFDLPSREGGVTVLGALEEGSDHALHVVVDGGDGPHTIIQPLSRDPASVLRIPGATTARIRGGRGIAIGEGGHILASLDGGGSWNEVQAPPFAMEAATAAFGSASDWAQIELSEIGVKLGSVARIGWGPSEAVSEPKPLPDAPRLEVPKDRDRLGGATQPLVCKSEGATQGTPPLLGSSQIRQLLQSKPAAKGTRREVSSYGLGRAQMLDTIALLEEEGPDAKGSSPAHWTLKWHDPAEIGGKPRSVTMPVFAAPPAKGAAPAPKPSAPKGRPASPGAAAKEIPWGASLRFAAASGGRALFSIRAAGKYILVRTKPSGGVDALEVPSDLQPSGEVVFGADKGEPIAWMHDNTLVVWVSGEAPRPVTFIPTHALRSLGQPNKDGIPVMLSATDWSILRTVPIPPLDKKAGAKPPAPLPPTLDGWAKATNLRLELGSLPACAAKPGNARFLVQRSTITAQVDGISEGGSLALYDVRIGGGASCVAAVSGLLTPDRRASQPSPQPAPPPGGKKKPAPADVTGPVAFMRVDILGKRAEGGDRGVPPAAMRKLSCSLGKAP